MQQNVTCGGKAGCGNIQSGLHHCGKSGIGTGGLNGVCRGASCCCCGCMLLVIVLTGGIQFTFLGNTSEGPVLLFVAFSLLAAALPIAGAAALSTASLAPAAALCGQHWFQRHISRKLNLGFSSSSQCKYLEKNRSPVSVTSFSTT